MALMPRLAVAAKKPPDPPSAMLVVLVGPDPGCRVPIDRLPFSIGSGHGCALVLPADAVAARHCTIDRTSDEWELRVEPEAPAIIVSDELVESALLRSGSRIAIGPIVLAFIEGDEQTLTDQFHELLYDLACRDQLTGAFSEPFMRELLEREIGRGQGTPLLLLIDLDGVEGHLDVHGRATVDRLLVAVARLLEARTSGRARVGRVGNEQFAVAVEDGDAPAAVRLAEALRAAIAATDHDAIHARVRATVSIGVASASPGARAADLWEAALRAVHRATESGGDSVVLEPIRTS
jgi:diguanylate cyclase (GGDEF)-like protein